MRHEIDKQSMMNDIILTIALIISLAIVTVISHIIDLYESNYKLPVFAIITFILVKLFYNAIHHIYKAKNK